ncbi:hypothetical protein VTH06DRAFT_933 [Thermothelomyces fergusii]
MATTKERPRARFAPIPIETTFERYRKAIPTAEPTPSPSPRSPSPPPREKRKFAPQLVESSVRRVRRAGDEGPATKHTDKTDITPYTNHIYAPKTRRRLGHGPLSEERAAQRGHGRRESCDDEIAGGVFDLAARDAQRKLQEVALSAFPNSGQRAGGAEHYYMGEGSDDDSPRGRTLTRGPWNPYQPRRNSSQEDMGWAFKEMQEHAMKLQRARSQSRIDTWDLDNMSIDGPPSDAMGLTRTQRTSIASSPLWTSRRPSTSSLGPVGDSPIALLRAESPLPAIGESAMAYVPPESPPPIRPIGEGFMPYIPSAPAGKAGAMPYAPASQIPPESGFRGHAPFAPYPPERDPSLERARQQHRLRLRVSPPMLGADLVFPRCPSPKQTKLEPTHFWQLTAAATSEEQDRGRAEQPGLWRGYCYTPDPNTKLAPAERPALIHTPQPDSPGSGSNRDRDYFSREPFPLCEEPASMDGHGGGSGSSAAAGAAGAVPEHRTRSQEPKGLHMLQNMHDLDEKLRREKAAADLEEKIAAEFDDHFVTQVYNYLSLGYPATARQYDEELSKISRIGIAELEKEDEAVMAGLWGADGPANREGDANGDKKKAGAPGHIMPHTEARDGVREEDRCPRWRALKLYVYEWARQHPDLDSISPLAWGVQERRGSWGV